VALLFDLFGYLSIVLHGLTIAAQAACLGGVVFLLALARPLGPRLGSAGPVLQAGAARIAGWAALALAGCEAVKLAMQCALLVGTVDLSVVQALGAAFALAGLVKIAAALVLAALLLRRVHMHGGVLLGLCAVILAAAVMTTHAAARLDGRAPLLAVSALHQLGAAIWLGGLPCFLWALGRLEGAAAWRLVGARYSRLSMLGVALIVLSAAGIAWAYVGTWQGLYGSAYGVMAGAKIVMLGMLLLLGLGNFLVVERLRADPAAPVLRLRRFVEVEIGIGLTIFLAASSLTSVPPAVDIPHEQVTWREIVERNTPRWPRLESPDHDALALPALQAKLNAEAQGTAASAAAFVPGAGQLPPRNAADIAWSEYNHHWAGIFVALAGLLALMERAGLRLARHWPLAFLGLAGFLLLRSDPEVWPMGHIGVFESLLDVEVLQHRLAALLVVVFALFEWRVRVGGLKGSKAELVFPLMCAVGGMLLLTHSHAIANTKEQLLIEISHTPLALAGLAAGWARWLELRLDGRVARVAGWVWPVCLVFVGLVLLGYREA